MDKNNSKNRFSSTYTQCYPDQKNPGSLICKEEITSRDENGQEHVETREYAKKQNQQFSLFGPGSMFSDNLNNEIQDMQGVFEDMDRAFTMFMPFFGNIFESEPTDRLDKEHRGDVSGQFQRDSGDNFENNRQNLGSLASNFFGSGSRGAQNEDKNDELYQRMYSQGVESKFNNNDIYDL